MSPHALCNFLGCDRCRTVAAFAARLNFSGHALSLLATNREFAALAVVKTASDLGLRGEA